MPFSGLSEQLEALTQQSLRRTRVALDSPQGVNVSLAGKPFLSFCSNDYLGLANHPDVIAAAIKGAQQYGVGAGASHLVTGHSLAHEKLESDLASFVRLPAALLFSTGYMANIGVVTSLLGREDAVFCDKLNHASLNDAALLSRAKMHRYHHGDLAMLEQWLAGSTARRKLVISDSVFSMDGDIAPAQELLALCERHDAALLLDDAHGFGVLGEGRGVLAQLELNSPRIIYVGTLGKAAGVFGAFVAGSEVLIETLLQTAKTYIYTTATPPMLAMAIQASLKIIRDESWRREHLQSLIGLLKTQLIGMRWALLPSYTAIQPLLMGDSAEAVKVSAALREAGILVPAIRPPTVAQGSARLRISLSAAHSEPDVMRLVTALKAIA